MLPTTLPTTKIMHFASNKSTKITSALRAVSLPTERQTTWNYSNNNRVNKTERPKPMEQKPMRRQCARENTDLGTTS